jgi:hypothetical protein
MSVTAEFSVEVLPMAEQGTCAICKFMGPPLPGSGQTVCRRYPPTVAAFSVPPGAMAAVWPPVGDDDTCGEYQPKVPAPAKAVKGWP